MRGVNDDFHFLPLNLKQAKVPSPYQTTYPVARVDAETVRDFIRYPWITNRNGEVYCRYVNTEEARQNFCLPTTVTDYLAQRILKLGRKDFSWAFVNGDPLDLRRENLRLLDLDAGEKANLVIPGTSFADHPALAQALAHINQHRDWLITDYDRRRTWTCQQVFEILEMVRTDPIVVGQPLDTVRQAIEDLTKGPAAKGEDGVYRASHRGVNLHSRAFLSDLLLGKVYHVPGYDYRALRRTRLTPREYNQNRPEQWLIDHGFQEC